jgi:hypothetical protein
MIQDENLFIKLINSELEFNEAIDVLVENGANQMTCVKTIMNVYKIRLREADEIVQNSPHWIGFKEGNEWIKNNWFK